MPEDFGSWFTRTTRELNEKYQKEERDRIAKEVADAEAKADEEKAKAQLLAGGWPYGSYFH